MIKAFILCALAASTLASAKCKYTTGKEYEDGETWIDHKTKFKMKCYIDNQRGHWEAQAIACLTDKGHELWPHDKRVEDGKLYSCEEAGHGLLETSWRDL